MRKIIALLGILSLILISACSASENSSINITTDEKADTTISEKVVTDNQIEVFVLDYSPDSIGGDNKREFCSKYCLKFYGVDTFLAQMVDDGSITEWADQFASESNPNGLSMSECNVKNFVDYFKIPKEDFIEENQGITYSEEQIEAIYSGDSVKIANAFANEYALVINGNIFTPDWLATHTVSDYEKNGITYELLSEYIQKIDIPELDFACIPISLTTKKMNPDFDLSSIQQLKKISYDPILYVIPDEIHDLLSDTEYEEWAGQFNIEGNKTSRSLSEFNIINITSEKGLNISSMMSEITSSSQSDALMTGNITDIISSFSLDVLMKDFSIVKGENTYSLEWLCTQTIDDFENYGITLDDLQKLLLEMDRYSFTSEYERIKSCVDRIVADKVN